MFRFIILVFLLIVILMFVYLIKRFRKFTFIDKIKNKKLKLLISLSPLMLFFIFAFFDLVNTIVIGFYIFIIFALTDIISLLVLKLFKKRLSYNITGLISIITAILYLSHAYFLATNIIQTNYSIDTKKNIENFRIVQISDTHIGSIFSGDVFISYMNRINALNPDIVVITGDFIDDDTAYDDMLKATFALGTLKAKYGVYFIYGNHDKGYYNSKKDTHQNLERELEKNDVIVLEDDVKNITDNIYLIGRKDSQDLNRLSISDITKDLDKEKYMIVLDHEPNDYENEKSSKVDLVLSGHTHGGQLYPLGQIGLMLKINDMVYGMKKIDDTVFIVNSGMGDWRIKFKTHTVSEYVVIDINK